MTVGEIRSKYLEFFKAHGHAILPSSSLIPENDPTTLFTGSGMQPLVPYLLGKNHPAGSRLADSQKCFRSGDIEEIGDNRHTTFFEMLGNWSLGDYFKKEQLAFAYEFFTKEVGISKEKLYVTCFAGDETLNLPKDTESAEIWKSLGVADDHIHFYDAKKNWWSRAGEPKNMPAGEPGGPDSEVFYEFTDIEHNPKFGEVCHPNCDCGRFLEIGNSVFMQYIKKEDGTFSLLPKQNVDFGGGLERIVAASNNNSDIFRADVFAQAIESIEYFSGKKYDDENYKKSFRIILDHIRASVFMIIDGVRPSSTDRGYFLRRLIRRAARHANKIGMAQGEDEKSELGIIANSFILAYRSAFSELNDPAIYYNVLPELWKEERQFRKTLERGVRELERFSGQNSLSAKDTYQLVTTYGFPLELILEEAGERGIKQIDIEGFKELLKAHQDLSRAGSEQKFKGGLADSSEKTTRLHTAHHLLLKALQIVLGPEVHQRGSNITQERLRIDFSYGQKMTDEQKAQVEKIVNEKIIEDIPMTRSELPKEEAEKLGAEHEFGAKYPDRVSVYSLGPKGATLENPQFEQAFSIEFCGGPHVSHTGELAQSGTFRILKEEAVSSGIRRIKAVLE